ncbi:MAG: sigma-70 family RNA polymerase sigma factor [Candidatus Margulisbacteria bacterium]|nr:sigma-70 family RNA polymerase sigma factor [Candidatus Margulisiibacteriota bacterium]
MTENVSKDIVSPVALYEKGSAREAYLITQAQNGDIAAFEQLIFQHQKKIYNIALQLSGNRDQAQDITQEALVKAFKAIKKFRGGASFTTWLYRIVHNTFLDELKKNYQKYDAQHVSLDHDHRLTEEKVVADVAEIQMLKNDIHQALAKLPMKLKSVLVMYELQGFSYEEISLIQKDNLNTIKSRIVKARKLLAKDPALKKYWGNQ